MSSIRLGGYKTIEPNEVFARKEKTVKDPENGRKINVSKLTILARYCNPTQQEVLSRGAGNLQFLKL